MSHGASLDVALTANHKMAPTVIEAGESGSELSVSFRNRRPGPEQELVDWFLEERRFVVPRGCRTTVFREPFLESGCPDLVLVFWRESRAQEWSPARAELKHFDIRVMHYLTHSGARTSSELTRAFGRPIGASLERLSEANMVRATRRRWVPRPLSKTFAATRIIAIEAKICDWRSALRQAHLNTWFAQESYILVPHVPRGELLLQEASCLGLGVFSKKDSNVCEGRPDLTEPPRSYVSWLFNEWAWRTSDLAHSHSGASS